MSSAALAGPPVVAATEAMTCRMRIVVSPCGGQLTENGPYRHHQSWTAITPDLPLRFRAAACRAGSACYSPPPMTDTLPADYRARLLARYVGTHASVGDAAAQEGLER